MKKRKIVLFAGIVLILAAVNGWLFRSYPTIDESRVHPSLRRLDDSTKCVWTGVSDGGSIEIGVVRADGTKVTLCMSNSFDHSFFERGQLYIGAGHFSEPGATKITGYDQTKYVVAKLLTRDLPKYPSVSGHIAILTKRIPDWISFMFVAGPKEAFDEFRIHL
jgi:hypothetical protein